MSDAQQRVPRVELLWWSGCPSHGQAREMLKMALTDKGLDPEAVDYLQIVTREEAEAEGFIGSPTIRIDGRDIVPPVAGDPPALTCRLYFKRDGRPSPLPDEEDLAAALTRAMS